MAIYRVSTTTRFRTTYVVDSDKPPTKTDVEELLKSDILPEFNQVFDGETVDEVLLITVEEYFDMWKENPEDVSDEEKLEYVKKISQGPEFHTED